jgi:hypothetical protein
MSKTHRSEERPYDAAVDSFQMLPDGLDSPYMILLAFRWLTPPGDLAQMPHRRFSGATLQSKTRAAGVRALTLLNPIALAFTGSSKK